jgi:hypothetical protein
MSDHLGWQGQVAILKQRGKDMYSGAEKETTETKEMLR